MGVTRENAAMGDTVAKKEEKRLLRNLRERERRRENKKLQVPKDSSNKVKALRREAQERPGGQT